MTARLRRRPPQHHGFVYWARCQMRSLDRWSSKAIFFICFAGILLHAAFH